MSDAEDEVPAAGGAAEEDEFEGLPEDEEEYVDNTADGDGDGDEGDGEGEGGEGEGGEGEDGEGGGEGEEGSADSSEEDEGSEQNEYEEDGFVVDEEEVEGEGGEDSDQEVRKKRRKRRRSYKLDEEDYMLLEDNQVTGVRRPLEQRKRLKRRGETRTKAAGAKQLRDELFGGEGDLEDELADLGPEGAGDADRAEREERRHRYDGDDFAGEGSDEMGDFIVGGEDVDKRRARRDARVAQEAGLTADAVQAATRMFGNFGELLDLHASHKIYGADATEEEEGLDEEEVFDEEGEEYDAAERRRLERQEKLAAKKQQRLLQHVDPELVDSHFLRPHDQTIRSTDLPERLQLLGKPVLEGLSEEDRSQLLNEAARWVADHLFGARSQRSKVRDCIEDGVVEVTGRYVGPRSGNPNQLEHTWPPWMLSGVESKETFLDLSNNRAIMKRRSQRFPPEMAPRLSSDAILEKWRNEPTTQEQLRQNVLAVLTDIFDRGEEVPVVAMFRKEDCGDLLSLRDADTPETTGNERKAGLGMDTEDVQDARFPRGTMQAKHRRIRRWDVLWAVFNTAVRFFDMHRRRQQRMDSYIKVYERSGLDAEREAITVCFNMLQQGVATAADMDDIDVKFRHVVEMASAFDNLSIGDGDNANGAEGGGGRKLLKRPGRANVIKRYLARGLGDLAQKVFLAMVAFSENVKRLDKIALPEDPDNLPEEWAEDEIQNLGLLEESEQQRYADISNPGGFLRALREIIATDLAAEPVLRSLVRGQVFSNATVSTKPTGAGEDVLDPFHPFGITKHLAEKQVASFEGTDTWLRILAAEKAGLIKVDLEFKTHEQDPTAFLGDVFLSDNVSEAAEAWNKWRKEVVAYAVRDKVVPALLQELRTHLTATAIETTLTQMQDTFWKFVSQPPVKILEVIDEADAMAEPLALETPRFMAVVWGAGAQGDGPTTIVQLDGNGNLKDLLTAPQLSGNVPRTVNSGDKDKPVFDPAADPKKSKDSHKIREKILEHKPNAILVATNAPQSKQIKDDMEKISQYTESDARFKDELLPHLENKRVDVFWSDHRLAALWANSEAAKAEFPDYSYQVRMAVGVGRLALDPLAILAVLCGPKKNILSLKMHDLQDMLPREVLSQRLEQTLISAVSQVGVDINAMVAYPWRQGPLQFVPGLGPRKARALLAAVAASDEPFVKTRVDLLKPDASASFVATGGSDMAQLGKTVFQAAAACLRVRHGTVAALQNEEEFDAVDDIRIHPTNEGLLQVVLDEAFPDMVESGSTADVRTAIESPNNLLALDLYGVAEHTNYKHKLLTLSDMLFELQAPYGEVRLGAASPSDEQAFYLRHGETADSLKVGRLVEGKVVWVGDSEVKIILQNNGMEAFIPQEYVDAENMFAPLGVLFKHGQAVTARILATNIGDKLESAGDQEVANRRKNNVTLSTQAPFLEDAERWEREYCGKADTAYRIPDKAAAAAAAAAGGAATPSRRVPAVRRQLQARPIEHPLWRNKRGTEVAAELTTQPPGSALFRPAMKPTLAERLCHISLSINLAKLSTGPLILNVDIKEAANKPPKQARLAAPLRIELAPKEEEQYDDLDEVVARYVEPLVENVNQLFTHRKFQDGDSNAVNSHVRQQLSQQGPGAGAYCVAIDAARPGSAYIAYGAGGPESSIYKEWFNITPKGYYFRGHHFSDMERVLDAFKKDPNYKKRQKADGMGARMGAAPGAPPGYGQASSAYGQHTGGYTPHGGYNPQQQQQQQQQQPPLGYGVYGAGGYMPGGQPGQQPYHPAPAAAAAAVGYGRPPGAPPAGVGPGGYDALPLAPGGYGAVPQPYPTGYAPNPTGYNQAGGYQQQPYYGQAR